MSVFCDTNVLVYLFDADAPKKQAKAREIFDRHAQAEALRLSTQVLQELYVVLTRKLAVPLDPQQARQVVVDLTAFPVVLVDAPLIIDAMDAAQRYSLAFWDALVVQAARQSGATTLLSEDMQHGQVFDGVTVENPFLGCEA